MIMHIVPIWVQDSIKSRTIKLKLIAKSLRLIIDTVSLSISYNSDLMAISFSLIQLTLKEQKQFSGNKSILISLFYYLRFIQSGPLLRPLTGVMTNFFLDQLQRQIFTYIEWNCKYKLLMHVLCACGFRPIRLQKNVIKHNGNFIEFKHYYGLPRDMLNIRTKNIDSQMFHQLEILAKSH